jgi:hypothetical protein
MGDDVLCTHMRMCEDRIKSLSITNGLEFASWWDTASDGEAKIIRISSL